MRCNSILRDGALFAKHLLLHQRSRPHVVLLYSSLAWMLVMVIRSETEPTDEVAHLLSTQPGNGTSHQAGPQKEEDTGCPVTGTAQEDECPNGLKSKGLVRRNHTKAPASKSIAIAMTSAAKCARPGCFILSPSAEVVSRAQIIDYSSVDHICKQAA